MSENYVKYLLIMVIVVVGGAAAAALFTIRKRRKMTVAKKIRPVDYGNISIFSNKQGNVTIIPYVSDLFGSGKATSEIALLAQPFKSDKLGAAVRYSLASCRNAKPIGSSQLMEILQARDWKEFSKGRLNLSVYFKQDVGIVFNTTARTSEGGYVFNTKGEEHYLPADVGDDVLGSTVLVLLKRCVC